MSGERIQRRLAAILASDVVGYSRLMGEDEVGTLAALKTLHRELIDPKVRERCGHLVKTTGDGALVEFASVEPPPESGTTSMGHFDRFPQPKLNGRCPFS